MIEADLILDGEINRIEADHAIDLLYKDKKAEFVIRILKDKIYVRLTDKINETEYRQEIKI